MDVMHEHNTSHHVTEDEQAYCALLSHRILAVGRAGYSHLHTLRLYFLLELAPDLNHVLHS
jgi:hypothetical protein